MFHTIFNHNFDWSFIFTLKNLIMLFTFLSSSNNDECSLAHKISLANGVYEVDQNLLAVWEGVCLRRIGQQQDACKSTFYLLPHSTHHKITLDCCFSYSTVTLLGKYTNQLSHLTHQNPSLMHTGPGGWVELHSFLCVAWKPSNKEEQANHRTRVNLLSSSLYTGCRLRCV